MIKIWVVLCFTLVLFSVACNNHNDHEYQVKSREHNNVTATKEKWHFGNAQKQNESAGYAQVVKVGNTLYISGVPTADLSPKGIAGIYKTLEKCLNAFGATSKDVVKETLYTTDIETVKNYNDARKAFYKGDFPAASWLQVSRLYEPDAKLEIELIAQL